MIPWMLYGVFVASILAATARIAERLSGGSGRALRWIWSGALALTVSLCAWTAVQGSTAAEDSSTGSSISVERRTAGTARELSWSTLDAMRERLRAPLESAVGLVRHVAPPASDRYALGISSLASVVLGLVFLFVARRFSIARGGWPTVVLHGIRVRVARHVGPVVIGIVRPEIVVPRWLLDRSDEEQRLVVTHEHEHVRAHDPLLLLLAWGVAILLPWNPAVWYMLSRLRLAVELDCDARVLRRGTAPGSYGALLIDVAAHASMLGSNALALADDASHLRQRILAMNPSGRRFARSRNIGGSAIALVGALVACQTTLPSDTDTAGDVVPAVHADSARTQRTEPLVLVDGVAITMSEMKALDPAKIDRVEVVKGPAAARRSSDPRAVNGIIVITMKRSDAR